MSDGYHRSYVSFTYCLLYSVYNKISICFTKHTPLCTLERLNMTTLCDFSTSALCGTFPVMRELMEMHLYYILLQLIIISKLYT